jgi:DNA-directed RNA polymerase subunit RPC12/RpoP
MIHVIVSVQNLINEKVKMQAYCMKCKKKVEIKNPKAIAMKNKRAATQGVCPSCGTKVFRIGKS